MKNSQGIIIIIIIVITIIIKSNRPVLVVRDCKRKTCLLIDTSGTTDNNISVKEYNKIGKYKDLEIENWVNMTP